MTSIPKDHLRVRYVGKNLQQLPTPCAVLDLAKVETNCNLMLEAAQRHGLEWRAQIKTHKTAELTRLQVGDDSAGPVNIAVSTILEAESILPLLKEYQENSRRVNLLYAFPLFGSCIERLAEISAQLGPGGLSVMIDNVVQIKHLTSLASKSGNPPMVFLKINLGTQRAGVEPGDPECNKILNQLQLSEAVGSSVFLGLYCHAGHSYSARSEIEAAEFLVAEFRALQEVAKDVRHDRPLLLSVGATPTVTTLQQTSPNGIMANGDDHAAEDVSSRLASIVREIKKQGYRLEAHAGVYPTLDLQQLATRSRNPQCLNSSAIAITILAEVVSIYPSRGPGGKTEALINAGSLALGREPCEDRGQVKGQHYNGWGIVTPWNTNSPAPSPDFPAVHSGWEVVKISQEHGVLRWVGPVEDEAPLHVGQRVRIWPNHSCIAGAGHRWYHIVDSRKWGREDEVVDVWPRCSGW